MRKKFIISKNHVLLFSAGDFGGTMGLWLGASVLAAVQLLDYIIMCCSAKCSRSKTGNAGKANGTTRSGTHAHINECVALAWKLFYT